VTGNDDVPTDCDLHQWSGPPTNILNQTLHVLKSSSVDSYNKSLIISQS